MSSPLTRAVAAAETLRPGEQLIVAGLLTEMVEAMEGSNAAARRLADYFAAVSASGPEDEKECDELIRNLNINKYGQHPPPPP